MPRIIDHDRRKATILLRALSLFEENGLENTTLTQIARRCKIGRPTLYQYFRNKDEIFQYSIKYYTDHMFEHYEKLANGPGEPIKRLESILMRLVKTMRHESMFLRALVTYYSSLQLAGRTKEFHKAIRRRTILFRRLILRLLMEATSSENMKTAQRAKDVETVMMLAQNMFFQIGIFDREFEPYLHDQIKITMSGLHMDTSPLLK